MKTLRFFLYVVPLCFIVCLIELPERICSAFMGFSDPTPAWKESLKYEYKIWRGIKPEKSEITCENGYLYAKVTFEDGSTVLVR